MSGMRGLGGLVLVVAIAFGVVYWLGLRLPAEHRAVASGRVEASQDRVWTLVDDPATHSAWREGVVKVSLQQGDGHCWIESYRTMELTLCVADEVPKVRKVVRIGGTDTRFGGTWTYELQPLGPDATEVTVTEDGLVNRPLWRFMGHYVMGEATNVKQFIADLQAEAVRKR